MAGTSVQWYTQHYKDDTSGSTNWANQLNALNVPITGAVMQQMAIVQNIQEKLPRVAGQLLLL